VIPDQLERAHLKRPLRRWEHSYTPCASSGARYLTAHDPRASQIFNQRSRVVTNRVRALTKYELT